MNKKADFMLNFIATLLILMIILAVIIFVIGISDTNKCEDVCVGEIYSEAKSKANMFEYLTGDYEIICKCYYGDKIETKIIRK